MRTTPSTPSCAESCTVLILIVGVTVGGGYAIAALTGSSQGDGWYEGLERPSWTPSNSVFGPTWAVLYVTMALAGSFSSYIYIKCVVVQL